MQRVYLDSNVFIAFVKSELGKGFRLMAQDVEDFFRQAREKYLLVLSYHSLKEIQKIAYYSREEVIQFFNKRKIQIKEITRIKSDSEKAISFETIKDLIEVKEPSELIY